MARIVSNPSPLHAESTSALVYNRRFNIHEKKLAEAVIYNANVDDDFSRGVVASNFDNTDGTIYTGATDEVLNINSGIAQYRVYQLDVASASVLAPYTTSTGLWLNPIAAGDKIEMNMEKLSTGRCAFTVGSFATSRGIYFESKIKIGVAAKVAPLLVGFRAVAAENADYTAYSDFAAFNIGTGASGRINMSTQLATGGVSTTNTGLTAWANNDINTLRVQIDPAGNATWFVNGTSYGKSFTFANAAVIMPFIHLVGGATTKPDVQIQTWRCGNL